MYSNEQGVVPDLTELTVKRGTHSPGHDEGLKPKVGGSTESVLGAQRQRAGYQGGSSEVCGRE